MSILDKERSTASFPSRQMTYFLDGGREKTEKKERIRKLVEEDPVFEKTRRYTYSRSEMYKWGLQRINRVEQRRRELNLNEEELRLFRNFVGDTLPTMLHDQVFVPNLMGQMSPEQQKKWVPKAINYEILGCYAQTELGHGSNVQGLETTATFIPETDEFEVHTPTLSATKWWPGCMGKTANFAVVYARLILPTGDMGVHPFLVQLRCLETHKPLPGIKVGDIGAKFGTPSNDNGYLQMNKVRIPRDQMLMRFSKVTREGKYEKPPHSKLSYGTMVIVRAGIVVSAFYSLASAATIALRYSAVRRQGNKKKDGTETQIIDYTIQQYRLLPLVAAAYALQFTGRYMIDLYDTLSKNMNNGDFNALPEVHATSSGLKSLTTRIASDGIEECRKSCGGHGYLLSSGLPTMFADYVMSVTVEGDNYLLTQQTTRYLLKAYQQGKEGKPLVGNANYLQNVDDILSQRCSATTPDCFSDPQVQMNAYKHRAALLVHQTAELVGNGVASGKSFTEAWNSALVEIYRASNAHCYLTILTAFNESVMRAKSANPELYPILKNLQDLFALYNMENALGDFSEDGYLSPAQIGMLRFKVRSLLEKLRPEAIALVDSFNISDFELNSAIGRYDGKAYETLYEWAQKDPLNAKEVPDGYEEYLRPMFKKQGIFKSTL